MVLEVMIYFNTSGLMRVVKNNITVFGDQANDIEMFEKAGIKVAVANANNLKVFVYLNRYLYMPDTDWKNHLEYLEDLMPWSENIQAEYKR